MEAFPLDADAQLSFDGRIYISGQVHSEHGHVVIGIGFGSINKVKESKNYASFQHVAYGIFE
jgi:hypothetical protein